MNKIGKCYSEATPKSVTVISWFSIISGIGILVSLFFSFINPMIKDTLSKNLIPISVQYLISCAGVGITMVSGIMMLKGKNWARLLYVSWYIFSVGMSFLIAPNKVMLLPSAVVAVVISFFLFRPNVNEYFKEGQ